MDTRTVSLRRAPPVAPFTVTAPPTPPLRHPVAVGAAEPVPLAWAAAGDGWCAVAPLPHAPNNTTQHGASSVLSLTAWTPPRVAGGSRGADPAPPHADAAAAGVPPPSWSPARFAPCAPPGWRPAGHGDWAADGDVAWSYNRGYADREWSYYTAAPTFPSRPWGVWEGRACAPRGRAYVAPARSVAAPVVRTPEAPCDGTPAVPTDAVAAASDADADNVATPTPWRVLLTRDMVCLKHLRWLQSPDKYQACLGCERRHLKLEEQEVCLQYLSPGGCPTKRKATCYFRHVHRPPDPAQLAELCEYWKRHNLTLPKLQLRSRPDAPLDDQAAPASRTVTQTAGAALLEKAEKAAAAVDSPFSTPTLPNDDAADRRSLSLRDRLAPGASEGAAADAHAAADVARCC